MRVDTIRLWKHDVHLWGKGLCICLPHFSLDCVLVYKPFILFVFWVISLQAIGMLNVRSIRSSVTHACGGITHKQLISLLYVPLTRLIRNRRRRKLPCTFNNLLTQNLGRFCWFVVNHQCSISAFVALPHLCVQKCEILTLQSKDLVFVSIFWFSIYSIRIVQCKKNQRAHLKVRHFDTGMQVQWLRIHWIGVTRNHLCPT